MELRSLIENIWPRDIRSIIDLGCGDLWHTAWLSGVTRHIGVDIWPDQIKAATGPRSGTRRRVEQRPVYGWEPIEGDALAFLKSCNYKLVDAVLAIDIIEHLPKEEGLALLDEMPRVTKKLVICWAPLGMLKRGPYNPDLTENPHQVHLWGPTPEIFIERGWQLDIFSEWHQDGGAIFAWKFHGG